MPSFESGSSTGTKRSSPKYTSTSDQSGAGAPHRRVALLGGLTARQRDRPRATPARRAGRTRAGRRRRSEPCREASTSAILPGRGPQHRRRVRAAGRGLDRAAAPPGPGVARRVRGAGPAGRVRLDVGCGPGWHTAELGSPVVAFDAAHGDARPGSARSRPARGRVVADLEALAVPHRRARRAPGRTSATCTSRPSGCRWRSPTCTGRCRSAARSTCRSPPTGSARRTTTTRSPAGTSTAGRSNACVDVVDGAGFTIDDLVDDGEEWIDVEATRARTLRRHRRARTCACSSSGSNPSVYSADVGLGFARPGNRFWPAALAAGLVTRTHDPVPRAAGRRHRHDQHRAARDAARRRAHARRVPRRHRARRTARALAASRARCASSASPATASRSTRKATAGWQARAVRRPAGLRDAEHERPQRARQAAPSFARAPRVTSASSAAA